MNDGHRARAVARPGEPGGATARRRAVATGAAMALLGAGLVFAGGASGVGVGQSVWLALPPSLLAVAASRARVGAVLEWTLVTVAALAAWVAAGAHGGHAPVGLVAGVSGACAAVLVAVRERLGRERDVLREYALRDPLTGVANRRSLLIRADYEIARHSRAQRGFALVMLDLDGFKGLNDRFGHAAGDDLLREVAAALERAMRAQDTVARFGGDEFCILAPETEERGSARLATRVDQAVREVSAGLEGVAASVGVAIFPGDGVDAARLMAVADERLLEIKRRRPRSRTSRQAA